MTERRPPTALGRASSSLLAELRRFAEPPAPFASYDSPRLWNDPHISEQMLRAHFDPSTDAASYPRDRIGRCAGWVIERFGVRNGTGICDFGCGPGLWAECFAAAGADVLGIDISERSIASARESAQRQGLTIRYVQADYLDFATEERFDLVTMIHGDFSVLSPDQRSRLLSIWRRILSDNGRILFDVSSDHRFRNARPSPPELSWHPDGGFMSAAPHVLITSQHRYEPEQLLLDRYAVVEWDRSFELCVWDQCYTIDGLAGLLREHGLAVEEAYGDVGGSPCGPTSDRIAVAVRRGR